MSSIFCSRPSFAGSKEDEAESAAIKGEAPAAGVGMPEVVNLVSSEDEGDVQATELHGPGSRRRASDRASAGETVDLVSSFIGLQHAVTVGINALVHLLAQQGLVL